MRMPSMKKPTVDRPLTLAQRKVLRHLLAGRPANTGLSGMSEYGGLHTTLCALRRRGFLTLDNELTASGRDKAAELAKSQ